MNAPPPPPLPPVLPKLPGPIAPASLNASDAAPADSALPLDGQSVSARSPMRRGILWGVVVGCAFSSFCAGVAMFAGTSPAATQAAAPDAMNAFLPPAAVIQPARVELPMPVSLPPEVQLVPSTAPVAMRPMIHHVLIKTPVLGSTTGGMPYQKFSQAGEPLIGFRAEPARWFDHSIIRTLEPVYASDNIVVTDSVHVARPGYAVAGVILDGDQDVRAMRIVFMRVAGDGFDMNDTYQTDWIGEPSGKMLHMLGGNGDRVVGVYGRHGLNQDALGLILRAAVKTAQ